MSQRKRIHKPVVQDTSIVKVLAELYELDERLTMRLYNYFDRSIAVTKLHLSRFYKVTAELDFIDTHNYSF